jgi:hypothetical protein
VCFIEGCGELHDLVNPFDCGRVSCGWCATSYLFSTAFCFGILFRHYSLSYMLDGAIATGYPPPSMATPITYEIYFYRFGDHTSVQQLSALPAEQFRSPFKKSGVSRSALVDTAPSRDELLKRLGLILDPGHVPHNPRPLASGSLVNHLRVGGAPNDSGKRVFPLRHVEPPRPQGSPSSFHRAPFGGPPSYQVVDGRQIAIDRVPSAATLAFRPRAADPVEVLTHGFLRVGNYLRLWLLVLR